MMISDLFSTARNGVLAGCMVGMLAVGCAGTPDTSTDGDTDGLTGDNAPNGRCDHCPPPPPPPAKNCKYDAVARAVDIHLLADLKIPLLDTSKILSPGGIHVPFSDASIGPGAGHAKADLLDLKIPNLLRARVLDAEVEGGDCKTSAVAEIANVELGLSQLKLLEGTSLEFVQDLLNKLGLQADIQVDLLKASANASCEKGKPVLTGSSDVLKVRLGTNNLIHITGEANQRIEVLGEGLGKGIYIIINEQIVDTKGNSGSIQVNALHVNVLDLADVVVSAAKAGITCL